MKKKSDLFVTYAVTVLFANNFLIDIFVKNMALDPARPNVTFVVSYSMNNLI